MALNFAWTYCSLSVVLNLLCWLLHIHFFASTQVPRICFLVKAFRVHQKQPVLICLVNVDITLKNALLNIVRMDSYSIASLTRSKFWFPKKKNSKVLGMEFSMRYNKNWTSWFASHCHIPFIDLIQRPDTLLETIVKSIVHWQKIEEMLNMVFDDFSNTFYWTYIYFLKYQIFYYWL